MKILADLHISPRTVEFLCSLGYDAVRVNQVMSATATDAQIIEKSISESRVILTQDMDFSALIALSGRAVPSLICLRLSSSRIEYVNGILKRILPGIEEDLLSGTIVTVQDHRIRRRKLPLP